MRVTSLSYANSEVCDAFCMECICHVNQVPCLSLLPHTGPRTNRVPRRRHPQGFYVHEGGGQATELRDVCEAAPANPGER